jgi:hypothetical protein
LGTYWKLRHWRGWSTAIHGFGVELRFGERFSAPQQSTSAPGRHVRVISVLEQTSRACIQPAHGSGVPCPRRSTDSRAGKDAGEKSPGDEAGVAQIDTGDGLLTPRRPPATRTCTPNVRGGMEPWRLHHFLSLPSAATNEEIPARCYSSRNRARERWRPGA